MVLWYLGLLGGIIGLFALYFFARALQKMSGELRSSLFFLFAAGSCTVLLVDLISVFGLRRLEISSVLWQVLPVLFFISSVLFAFSMKKLASLFQKLARESAK